LFLGYHSNQAMLLKLLEEEEAKDDEPGRQVL
jgi:hypothetical protein